MQIDLDIKTGLAILASSAAILGTVVTYVVKADDRYVDTEELRVIQQSLSIDRLEDRRIDYQDKVDYLKDKEIDGNATPADRKKRHRYETRVKEINQKIQIIESNQ